MISNAIQSQEYLPVNIDEDLDQKSNKEDMLCLTLFIVGFFCGGIIWLACWFIFKDSKSELSRKIARASIILSFIWLSYVCMFFLLSMCWMIGLGILATVLEISH